MKSTYIFFGIFLLCSCGGPVKDRIKINAVSILFIEGKEMSERITFNGDKKIIKNDEGLLLLRFNVAFYGSSDSGPFSGSVEPGLSGVDKTIRELKIISNNKKDITSSFTGLELENLKFDGNPINTNYIDSLSNLKDEVNKKVKPYIGVRLRSYFVFKYSKLFVPDTSNAKVILTNL